MRTQDNFRAPARGQMTLAALAALTMLGVLLAGCASAATASGGHASVTATPATTQGRLTQRVEQAVGAAARDVTLIYTPASASATVSLT
ncbi:MAG TPA: hypothetical protein VID72_11710, partial [Ktedonobacterales bacterium]